MAVPAEVMSTIQLRAVRPNHGPIRAIAPTKKVAFTGAPVTGVRLAKNLGRAFLLAIAASRRVEAMKKPFIAESTAQAMAKPRM